ncbi:MAG: chromosomal replication initiator protein DnaA [Fibrobacterota bacterium]
MDKNTLWKNIIASIKEDLSIREVSFDNWLKPLHPLHFSRGVLLLKTDNPFGLELLNSRYAKKILRHGQNITPDLRDVKFTLEENAALPSTAPEEPEESAPGGEAPQKKVKKQDRNAKRVGIFEHPINKKFTFDSFLESEETALAFRSFSMVAQTPGVRRFNPLFVYGNHGCGKTHLLHAAANAVLSTNPDFRIVITGADDFYHHFYTSLHNKSMDNFNSTYEKCDMLIIDDVQNFSGKEACQIELFKIFNILHQKNKQMIFSSPTSPFELKGIDERLMTRFQWGLSLGVDSPRLETRAAMLYRMLQNEGVKIRHDALDFIAEKGPKNIGELEGIIVRLTAHYSLHGDEITLDDASRLLYHSNKARPRITVANIIHALVTECGVSHKLLLGKSRSQEIARARQLGMYLCKKNTDLSLKAIGLEFGGRDHSTVVHAVKTIDKKSSSDAGLVSLIDTIIKRAQQL